MNMELLKTVANVTRRLLFLFILKSLPHIRIFFCVVDVFKTIQFHMHITLRPRTVCRSHKELIRAGTEPATRCAAVSCPATAQHNIHTYYVTPFIPEGAGRGARYGT
ncbi:hypothetical protein SFRURICE_003620 [Spodoptera frugiperda]|nr:hypothetical protein SFRURICE_003620 [Spodoptera frugiperda]